MSLSFGREAAAGSQLSSLCFAELAGGLLPSLYLLQERSGTGVWGWPEAAWGDEGLLVLRVSG